MSPFSSPYCKSTKPEQKVLPLKIVNNYYNKEMKELLDDELDPKFFDKDNYNTLTIALNNGKERYKEKTLTC